MKSFRERPIETVKGNHQMINRTCRFAFSTLLTAAIFLAAGFFAIAPSAVAQSPEQRTFSSADDALQALVSAAQARDRAALAKVFGSDYNQLLSGDDVEDARDLDDFALAIGESARLQKVDDSNYTVTVGKDNWPSPIPLARN